MQLKSWNDLNLDYQCKVDGTCDFVVHDLLDKSDDPVVVFVWFQETARLLQGLVETASRPNGKRPLVCKTLTGEMLVLQVVSKATLIL